MVHVDVARVAVTFGSYINRFPQESNGCTPTGFADTGINTFDGVLEPGRRPAGWRAQSLR
jgi:hypothetical protein